MRVKGRSLPGDCDPSEPYAEAAPESITWLPNQESEQSEGVMGMGRGEI